VRRVEIDIGSKFEHNDFTGFEAQPSVRITWMAEENHAVWGAISRAVRTPTRFDTDIRFGPPGLAIFGNPNFQSENLTAYEVGYRARRTNRLSFDVTTFINTYEDLRSLEFRPPNQIFETNNLPGKTYGGEVDGSVDVASWMRLHASYAYLFKRLKSAPGTRDFFNGSLEGNETRHQFQVQASTNLPGRVEYDTTLRFVSRLPDPVVPRYMELDARLGWDATRNVELSIVGRNLLDTQHPEFGPPSPFRVEVERNIYGRLAFRF